MEFELKLKGPFWVEISSNALVQGLRKAIELKVENLKVYGDSKIIVK